MTHQITLHYFGYTDNGGRSDKVYIITMEAMSNGHYSVNARWGRRGGTLSSQNKGVYATHWQAVAAFNSLASEKMDKGYKVTGTVGSFSGSLATAGV